MKNAIHRLLLIISTLHLQTTESSGMLAGRMISLNSSESSTSPKATKGSESQPLLTSLGLAVIDEIHFGSGDVVRDVLGGSGTYCESQTFVQLVFDYSDPRNYGQLVSYKSVV